MSAVDGDRQVHLFGAKLRALVRGRWPGAADRGRVGTFLGGASLATDDAKVDGDHVGWVLVGEGGGRRLGAALAWAHQRGVAELHVLADRMDDAGVLARRAAYFARAPRVWQITGRTLAPAEPASASEAAVPPPEAELYRLLLQQAGVEVAVEGGELLAEVQGLEVARVVPDKAGGARLDVGVGRFDREAFAMMNADLPDADALAKAAGVVRQHRRPGAARHPLNQLVPERWLRALLIAEPERIGATGLVPVESALRRRNLRDTAPASTVGTALDTQPVVVTCSVGVDLELVPTAADDRALHSPDARLVLVVPERDAVPVTRALAAALARPADVVTVSGDWNRDLRASPQR